MLIECKEICNWHLRLTKADKPLFLLMCSILIQLKP